MDVSRRTVLRSTAILPVAGAAPAAITERVGVSPGRADGRALTSLNLGQVQAYDVTVPDQALLGYGWLHAAATLQGIVNRNGPALFLDFLRGDERSDLRIDEYWMQRAEAQAWPSSTPARPIADIPAAVTQFHRKLRGAVVWDPSVPATSNVASTVAGADDLVAVPYDPSPDSAYSHLVDPTGRDKHRLHVGMWLVRPDGSPLFTGRGVFPGTGRRSTGSAKADAYLWAVVRYLASGRSNPTELGYYLDAFWLSRVSKSTWPYPIQNTLLCNHDFLVARRGFVFDLSLWPDEAPEDDPGQRPGTDLRVLREILGVASRRAGAQMPAIRGFVPWAFKYTSAASNTSRELAGHAEWKFVEIASSYGCYLDADAEGLDPMANASLFAHYPVPSRYPAEPAPTVGALRARGYLDSAGRVAAKRYVMVYTGDFDSAAWLYHMIPRVWDDPARGTIPLNWAFNPDLAERMPLGMVYTRSTASANDHFISGDSGAGYVSPGAFEHPTAEVGGALRRWTQRNLAEFRHWGLSITGFIIDGTSPALSESGYERSYATFSPAGIVTSKSYPYGVMGQTPYVRMGTDLSGAGSLIDVFATQRYERALTDSPLRPHFSPVRTILKSASWHKDLMAAFSPDLPAPPFTGVRDVSVELAATNVSDGLRQVDAADGVTTPVTVAGKTARSTAAGADPTGNRYFYFDIDDTIAHDSTFQAVFTIEYLDTGTTAFNVQYDGTDPFSGAGSISRNNTGTWKTATLPVSDARFANREQGTFDFRFETVGGTDLVVHQVSVAIQARQTYPDAQIEFLDAPTFFALLGIELRNQVVPECSAAVLVPGATTDAVFRVHNYSDSRRLVDVTLSGPSSVRIGTARRRVTVPARGDVRVAWPVRAAQEGPTPTLPLVLSIGRGPDGRQWSFVPRFAEHGYRVADAVDVTLGATNVESGIRQVELGFDGTTTAGTAVGRDYRTPRLVPNGFTDESYIYFDIDDTFMVDEDGVGAEVRVDFLDEPDMWFRVDYDAVDRRLMLDGVTTPTRVVRTRGTGTWRSETFRLRRVAFANRMNGSPDTRPVGVVDLRIATASQLKVAALRVRRG